MECTHEWETECYERRWFAGGEIHEESREYEYCVKCGTVKKEAEVEIEY